MTADSHGESDAPKAGSSTAAIQPRVEAGGDSGPLAQCAAPAQRVWPAQFVSFQREITSTEDAEHEFQLSLKGWPIEAHLKVSVLASFIQQWTVREVGIGDLAATVSLGPGEVYTIEIRNTRRTLLEESRETASTIEDASEQTSSDKEALTVANTSSRASNWSVAGSGGFSMSGVGASGSATQSGTISNSVARTINEVHDTTLRSSRKLSTQT